MSEAVCERCHRPRSGPANDNLPSDAVCFTNDGRGYDDRRCTRLLLARNLSTEERGDALAEALRRLLDRTYDPDAFKALVAWRELRPSGERVP